MMYPNRKEDANNSPYHLTANAPILNISGLTSQGIISKCMFNFFYNKAKGRKYCLKKKSINHKGHKGFAQRIYTKVTKN
jgi:hypothetical protein